MKSDKLQDAVGLVRDDFIEDAEYTAERQAKIYPWVKWVAVAACLAVAALVAVYAIMNSKAEAENTPEPPTVNEYEGTAGGGFHEFQSYDTVEEFSTNINDAVFEAFAESDVAKRHTITYGISSWDDEQSGKKMVQITMDFNDVYESSPFAALSVMCYNYEPALVSYFKDAELKGVRTDYTVDGVEVLKFSERDLLDGPGTVGYEGDGRKFRERVHINDLWYYVVGTDEAEVDAVATEFAHIAAKLGLADGTKDVPEYSDDFAAMTDDALFAAFAASKEAKQYKVVFGSAPFEVNMSLYDPTTQMEVVSVALYSDALRINGDFAAAGQFGLLSTRTVNGCEIQKYDRLEMMRAAGEKMEGGNPWYCERVSVGDAWYHVEGGNEAEVDAVADALARVAATL